MINLVEPATIKSQHTNEDQSIQNKILHMSLNLLHRSSEYHKKSQLTKVDGLQNNLAFSCQMANPIIRFDFRVTRGLIAMHTTCTEVQNIRL